MRTGRTTAKDGHPRPAALGTSGPNHFLRTRVGRTQASWGS
jgi:hypothetical protein